MCVIAYKPRNVRFPSENRVRAMWERNPDGAGVMWRDTATDRVRFVKGFMKLKKLEEWIAENRAWLEEVECALHFRITTHGGTSKGNCHPFVVSESTDSHLLSGDAPCVLMHNGILDIRPRKEDISDSAELALRLGGFSEPMDVLAKFNEFLAGNRIVIMGPGETRFYGDAFKESSDKDGLLYSNLHWENLPVKSSAWYDAYDADDFNTRGFSYSGGGATVVSDPCGWSWNHDTRTWRSDVDGREVDFEEVDPDYLSEEDFDEWYNQSCSRDFDRAVRGGIVSDWSEYCDPRTTR